MQTDATFSFKILVITCQTITLCHNADEHDVDLNHYENPRSNIIISYIYVVLRRRVSKYVTNGPELTTCDIRT
jgi:hypothetical protein